MSSPLVGTRQVALWVQEWDSYWTHRQNGASRYLDYDIWLCKYFRQHLGTICRTLDKYVRLLTNHEYGVDVDVEFCTLADHFLCTHHERQQQHDLARVAPTPKNGQALVSQFIHDAKQHYKDTIEHIQTARKERQRYRDESNLWRQPAPIQPTSSRLAEQSPVEAPPVPSSSSSASTTHSSDWFIVPRHGHTSARETYLQWLGIPYPPQ